MLSPPHGCKSLPTAKKPGFKPDSDLKARFKMYDENQTNAQISVELWGGALSATGAALGIVGLLEDTSG
jgi:hypothetical protein